MTPIRTDWSSDHYDETTKQLGDGGARTGAEPTTGAEPGANQRKSTPEAVHVQFPWSARHRRSRSSLKVVGKAR